MHPHYNEQRFARVLAHLHRHYRDDLDLNRLAEAAHLSPYHWHRIYHAVMGETIHATLKRIRLHHAAWLLGNSNKSLADIARDVGYGGNAQSFARIFRDHYGISAQAYRQQAHAPYQPQRRPSAPPHPVSIRHIDAIALLALDHQGDYMHIGDTFHRLYSLLHLRGHTDARQLRSFGIYHHDPLVTPKDALYAQAAVALTLPEAASPLTATTIAAGRYAVMRHQGPYAELERAYHWFYQDWLLASPYQIADRPLVEEYLNDVQTTAPGDLLTDIYIPLAQA